MREYNPKEIESKWQAEWERSGVYSARDKKLFGNKPKWYSLIEFPYPSGDGLHVGHPRPYIGMDVVSRKRRMQGYNVLYPIGWDAFGLPTENYAIKTGKDPRQVTKENTDTFRRQIKSLGVSFDWAREINTTDPKYYKWTQWLFLKFLEKGLAYKARIPINWCPKDKIGLANEEVVDGRCERCGTPVEQKDKEQWMLKITAYADRLYDDLETVDYPERVRAQQRNWIGKSEGALIKFDDIEVFTTRPDTIYGATFLVKAGKQDRFTGEYVTNPATKEKIPVWEAEYVYADYGTGAIMGVPADDERDRIFAEKYNLPITKGYKPAGFEEFGKKITKFKLRDWVVSRQRYWGVPIPVIHCEKCGIVPVPDEDLPVALPEIDDYLPRDDGKSPLSKAESWVRAECPKCGGVAERETDTLDTFVDSSWYFLRYIDPSNQDEFVSRDKLKQWMPVDFYSGGAEHTTMHLLYSRFWHKVLFDLGLVNETEPYERRMNRGLIMGPDGQKMSKSRGNVIDPDREVERLGADTVRTYLAFIGPYNEVGAYPWNPDGSIGVRRFLERVWKLKERIVSDSVTANEITNQIIQKVTASIESMKMNTAVSSLMIYTNHLQEHGATKDEYETLLKLLAPFAPHITEEIWHELGHSNSIHTENWPKFDETKLVKSEVVIAIQVNGKVRGSITVSSSATNDEVQKQAISNPEIGKWIKDKEVAKVIVIPQKIVNIVVK